MIIQNRYRTSSQLTGSDQKLNNPEYGLVSNVPQKTGIHSEEQSISKYVYIGTMLT